MGSCTSPPRPIWSPVLNSLQPVPQHLVPPSCSDHWALPNVAFSLTSLWSAPLGAAGVVFWCGFFYLIPLQPQSLCRSLPLFNMPPKSSAVAFRPPFGACVLTWCSAVSEGLCANLFSSVPLHCILCGWNASHSPAASPPTSHVFLAHCAKQKLDRCFHQKEKQTTACNYLLTE